MPELSKRSAVVKPFLAMDMMREANALEAAGSDIVHMEVGQPSSPPPRAVVEAAKNALDNELIGYTNALGLPQLRERIARHYLETYGVKVPAERVVVTTGSSGGFVLAFLAAFEAGDKVALPMPGYPAYKNLLAALGLQMVELATGPKTRWAPDPDEIAALAGTIQGVLIASPNNPTGTMLTPDALRRVCDACKEAGLWFISDEIYHGLTYDVEQATALQFSDDAIIINSFSKYFCMTGWRIGWMVVPECYVDAIDRIAQNVFLAPPTISQYAALTALKESTQHVLDERRDVFKQRRDFLLPALEQLGFEVAAKPQGAFYIYANCERFTDDSYTWVKQLLNEQGVALTPGIDFGNYQANKHCRFAYTLSLELLEQAVDKIDTFIKSVREERK